MKAPTGQGDGGPDRPDRPEPLALARDWITLWQSELSALVADREVQEAWQRLIANWAAAAEVMLAATAATPLGEPAGGRSGSAAPPRPAAAAAAPDPRDAEIARLRARIDALEQRLASLERGGTAVGHGVERNAGGRERGKAGEP